MATSTVKSKGRTTIPRVVRTAVNIKPGTRLAWHVTPGGGVIVHAKTLSILELAGALRSDRHVDIEEMNPWQN
ncbi:AbrB/MazE/SpoVT family DNA-binding domain-containing protein [Paraburkholderia caribensis]|uniref:AbrB/MazE/SpoVT family DNA-binding domain-containing protein n=1 Tax=Paraburkholderia TaxID=1822464 RepID=UPI001CB34A8C|nr:AbrB/MazE/SpoVT family DNA-binding domain-containing protein [Paraburkholderia caribensis]BEU25572.1 AbrB/MazE/SpoVT family DNA-binding domain-containing protein [Paraburkholderia sp. 22B1P]CAG9262643.1 AbrB family transcriptional regulator [Paraburkholderia caribensis]